MASFDFDYFPTPSLAPLDTGGELLLAADFDYIPLEASGEASPPTVTVVSPTPGSPLSPGDQVTIDVVDNIALGARPVILFVVTPFATETAFDGQRFRAPYVGLLTPIAGGVRLSVRRSGGWQGVPTFEAIATDARGAEA